MVSSGHSLKVRPPLLHEVVRLLHVGLVRLGFGVRRRVRVRHRLRLRLRLRDRVRVRVRVTVRVTVLERNIGWRNCWPATKK